MESRSWCFWCYIWNVWHLTVRQIWCRAARELNSNSFMFVKFQKPNCSHLVHTVHVKVNNVDNKKNWKKKLMWFMFGSHSDQHDWDIKYVEWYMTNRTKVCQNLGKSERATIRHKILRLNEIKRNTAKLISIIIHGSKNKMKMTI